MADFRIWGRVEQIGPAEFFVIASAIPDAGVSVSGQWSVRTGNARSLHASEALRDALMRELGFEVGGLTPAT